MDKLTQDELHEQENKLQDEDKLAQDNKLSLYSSFNKHCKRNILHSKYKNDEKCSICLLTMLNKLTLHTPCQHYFHYDCIKAVYTSEHTSKNKCPLCRYDLSEAIYNAIIQNKNASAMGANGMGANGMGARGLDANAIESILFTDMIAFDVNDFLLDLSIIYLPRLNLPQLDMSGLDMSDLVDSDGNEIIVNSQIHQELVNVISVIMNLIKFSFHPECFRMMMLINLNLDNTIVDHPIICHLCNYTFLNNLHSDTSSIQIDQNSYDIIHEYIINYPTIFNLINDIIQIMNFESIQRLIDFIYTDAPEHEYHH